MDAASNTCSVIGEFFTALSPTTSCTVAEVQSFVTNGWDSVDVALDSACTATSQCAGATPSPTPVPATDPSVGCAAATLLAVPSSFTGSTVGETVYNSVSCGTARDQNSAGTWFQIVGTGFTVTASLCDSSGDTQISVWTGSCNTLACVVGNDDDCGLRSSVTFATVLGETYSIFVCK